MVAAVVATVAFVAYTQTLLPGVDLGDTGGFQAAVLWPDTSARQAYPLYYQLARPFVGALSPGNPARGLNLFSAVSAAVAAGLLAWISGLVTRSAAAGAAAGLLFAFSLTFWTNAIIAEVYALHLALIGLCLVALRAFANRPTTPRLALFLAIYATAFGNHLLMILLLPAFTVFLFAVHPSPRQLFRPATIAMAVAFAIAGALQYLPNALAVWWAFDAPPRFTDRLAAFWFDTTKADWRQTMVLGVDSSELRDRVAMWWWDARQQFGAAGLAVAAAGAVRLWWLSHQWALLVWIASAVSMVFALTYNVGDAHVFFLPVHFFAAFAVAAAVAPSSRRRLALALPLLVIAYSGWRAWDTWPVADRHNDARGDQLVAGLTAGVDDRTSVLVTQIDWQSENALLYSARYSRRRVAWTRLPAVLPHLPSFVADNHAIGRDLVLTAAAAADVLTAFGPAFPIVPDETVPAPLLSEIASRIRAGSPYVLTLLPPPRDEAVDTRDFDQALKNLGAAGAPRTEANYQVWAGVAGERPGYHRAGERPFRDRFSILGDPFEVRMEAWLPFDTFRRGGFGHVLQGRRRVLMVERGVSLAWLESDGTVGGAYMAGLYAVRPRFRIPAPTATLVKAEWP